MDHNIVSHVLAGVALSVALAVLFILENGPRKRLAFGAFVSALIGIFAPSVGFYILTGELILMIVIVIRGLASVRWPH